MLEKDSRQKTIEALLQERRTFEPPEEFASRRTSTIRRCTRGEPRTPTAGGRQQAERLDWFERWDQVLEWDPPHHRWFMGGKLNAAHNCLDRHLA